MKTKLVVLSTLLGLFPLTANANWLEDIFNAAMKIYNVNLDIRKTNQAQLDETKGIKSLSQSQLNEVKKIVAGLTGTHEFGNQNYDPNQFYWGKNTDSWQSILALTSTGGGEGALGSAIKQLSGDFPIKDSLGSSNDIENQYYRLQAQTALASRASAQTAFDQMNNEDQTMKQLHGLIDSTPDNKSAVDLNNRLIAENTMVNVQQAKLLAVLVQQLSINSQANANLATENAAFFDIK